MARSGPASAGRPEFDHALTRRLLGVAFACGLAVSCSGTEPSLNLSPGMTDGAAVTQSAVASASSTGESEAIAKPAARPKSGDEALLAESEDTRQPPEAARATAQSGPANTEALAGKDSDEPEEVAESTPSTPARDAAPLNQKRPLLSGLFASAQAEAPPAAPAEKTQEETIAAAPDSAGSADDMAASPAMDDAPETAVTAADAQSPAADEAQPATPETSGNSQKRGLLTAFFTPAETRAPFPGNEPDAEEETAEADAEDAGTGPDAENPVIKVAAMAPQAAMFSDALPGVRERDQLFEIRSRAGIDDASLDLYESADGSYQVASAAGLARLAPHGLMLQREDVNVSCFKPQLVRLLKVIERKYGKRIMVTSGYRSPAHNRRVNGAPKSMHMACAAADIQVEGVSKWELASFVRSLPGRGGVGTYCHTKSVHVDVGPERDWNWRCRR